MFKNKVSLSVKIAITLLMAGTALGIGRGSQVEADASDVAINSHSDIDPQDSIAFVPKQVAKFNSVPEPTTTPVSQNSKVDLIMMPYGLNESMQQQWLAQAKQVAAADKQKTGREQKIVMVDATVKTFTIGDSSVPAVSAVDVASYQSWMQQSDYNQLVKVGVKAIVVKVSESTTYNNPYAAGEISMAKTAGMNVSVYHFARFTSTTGAKNEAKNTANAMAKLGLSKNTLIFADMEDSSTITSTKVSTNLKAYYAELNALGYTNHGLYTSAGYATTPTMVDTIGNDRTWIAQYPYTPKSTSLQHSEYGAWQFSSTAQVPNPSLAGTNYIDASHDYNGLLLGTTVKPSAKKINQYVAINTKSGDAYSNFTGKIKSSLSSMYQSVFSARYAYQLDDNTVYYSIYDKAGKWKGYVDAADTKHADSVSGAAFTTNKYVTVTTKGSSYWKNFSWVKKGSTDALYHKTYLAKYVYANFNGQKYYSLYSSNGKWVGYLNTRATRADSGKEGTAFTVNKYVTVTTSGTSYWKNFSWVKKGNTSALYHKTYLAKYVYCNFNGSQYYSIYDHKGKWIGYINAKGVRVDSGKQGAAFTLNRPVIVTSKSGQVWKNFDWVKKGTLAAYYGDLLWAKYVYANYNGSEYYSLYTDSGKWVGYVNVGYTES